MHQQAAGIVGRGIQRPAHKAHALLGQPAVRRIQQGVGGLGIIGALKKAEGPALFIGIGIVLFVHNGCYAANGAAIAQHKKEFASGAFPEGMFTGREQFTILTFKARRPQGATFIQAPR